MENQKNMIASLLEELVIARGLVKEICKERGVPEPKASLLRMDKAISEARECMIKHAVAKGRLHMLPISSYHDVFVEIEGEKVQFSSLPFNMTLQLSRVAGWELWRDDDAVVSGEFYSESEETECLPFRLWFGNELVFDNTKK